MLRWIRNILLKNTWTKNSESQISNLYTKIFFISFAKHFDILLQLLRLFYRQLFYINSNRWFLVWTDQIFCFVNYSFICLLLFFTVLSHAINLVRQKRNEYIYKKHKKRNTSNYKVPAPFTFTYYDMFQGWCSVNVDIYEIKV